ncbi:hypothetical protein QOZ80_5BG0455870 [Eleusine coracana subsp. coracana]|nr:hypothetical protein QOZ80_5BG0455870 [Eleusine coracana subsp. coracana]
MGRKIPLKLLVDTKSNRVLFAEAGKEFVDFLFSLLPLPIGAVAKLVSGGSGTMRSIGRLYQSVDHISASSYLQSGGGVSIKWSLLRPKVLHPDARKLQLLQGCDGKSPPAKQKVYRCSGHCAVATVETKATCPNCGQAMSTEVVAFSLTTMVSAAPRSGAGGEGSSSSGKESGGGYVKGGLTMYMVMDGLEVTPMSAISSITFLNKVCCGGVEFEEKNVSVGMDEVLWV